MFYGEKSFNVKRKFWRSDWFVKFPSDYVKHKYSFHQHNKMEDNKKKYNRIDIVYLKKKNQHITFSLLELPSS